MIAAQHNTRIRSGFTLVELSIVLVIIGLITGGIMAGRSMVRAAELRSVITDVGKFQSAVNTFREKYNALPGDMKNATAYWGALADGGPSVACSTATVSGTATCNGNGDGGLYDINGGQPGTNENFRFWQHLANAGLIEGIYTGRGTTASVLNANPGENVPVSKIAGGGYSVEAPLSAAPAGAASDGSGIDYGNALHLGAFRSLYYTTNPLLIPTDAYAIDIKMDDGFPTKGGVRQWLGDNSASVGLGGNCSSGTTYTDASSTYTLTYSGVACALEFLKVF